MNYSPPPSPILLVGSGLQYLRGVPTSTVEDSDGENNMSSADEDNTIHVICRHIKLTMRVYTLLVCVCVCMCAACMCVYGAHVCVNHTYTFT